MYLNRAKGWAMTFRGKRAKSETHSTLNAGDLQNQVQSGRCSPLKGTSERRAMEGRESFKRPGAIV